jgi:sugar phosphate isomerase/epimerase
VDCKASFATSPAPTGFAPLLFAGDLPAAAKAAGELGFDGIEISMKGPEDLSVKTLKDLLDRHRLELTAVASGRIYLDERATLSDPDEGARMRVVNRVRRLIDFAGGFGAPVIIGLLRGERPPDGDNDKAISLFVQSMQEAADHAASLGTAVILEAINRYETVLCNTAEQTVEVVKRIGRPNVKILLDVFHMNIEEVSIGEAIRATGDLLGHFHIVDSNRRAPGMGHVAFGDVAAALREIGYNGWLSGEHLPLPDSHAAAKQTRSFIRDL